VLERGTTGTAGETDPGDVEALRALNASHQGLGPKHPGMVPAGNQDYPCGNYTASPPGTP